MEIRPTQDGEGDGDISDLTGHKRKQIHWDKVGVLKMFYGSLTNIQ